MLSTMVVAICSYGNSSIEFEKNEKMKERRKKREEWRLGREEERGRRVRLLVLTLNLPTPIHRTGGGIF